MFPYHYGSYATAIKAGLKNGNIYMFPYHYGSYATKEKVRELEESFKFPYHYGSHATQMFRKLLI